MAFLSSLNPLTSLSDRYEPLPSGHNQVKLDPQYLTIFKLSCYRSVPLRISTLWTTTRRTTWRQLRRPRSRRPTAASRPTPRWVMGARVSRGPCLPRPPAERAPWPGSRGARGATWTRCRHAHWPGEWRGAGLTSPSPRPAGRARRQTGCLWCLSRSRSSSTAK